MENFFERFMSAIVADKDVAHYRMAICTGCDKFNEKRRCELCGCFMDIKTKIGSSKCPQEKW